MGRLTVMKDKKTYSLTFEKSESVLRILQRNGFSFRATCGGKGTCNHCLVVADGVKKKACQLLAEDGMMITLLPDALDIEVGIETRAKTLPVFPSNAYGAAIDIGTTTIALSLVDLSDGSILASHGFLNPNVSYGADVLSRIEASNNGQLSEIRDSLISSLVQGIQDLLDSVQVLPSHLESVCIAANTTMCHLLLGLSCETLGKAPFSPVMLNYPAMSGRELLDSLDGNDFDEVKITILPGLSAFLGGDITAGLFSLPPSNDNAPFLFVDLGTNGEMVLGTKEHFFATSVAAGPAFEGSRIPGSVVLDAVYELLRKRVLDTTGLLHGMFFHSGYRYQNHIFTQEDIRSIQLAKASVRAGIETLLHTATISAEDISHIYLCGGFGTHTNTDIAVSIGMFPESFRGKIVPMGNTSLAGAVQYLIDRNDEFFKNLQKKTEIVELASSKVYQEAYVRWMDFL
ncbi:MAG: ASKHA domain-containing protein [Lachnospiraceae bacterium]